MRQIAIAFLVSSLAALCSNAGAAVHRVDCAAGGDYLTIQEAVDAAASGDTILVAACVYEEEVSVIGKHVTIVGGGSDVTEITTATTGYALTFDGFPSSAPPSYLTDIHVSHGAPPGRALRIASHTVVMERCRVDQGMGLGSQYGGAAEISDCVIDELSVGGIGGHAVVSECAIGLLTAGGGYDGWEYWWGFAESAANTIGTLRVVGGVAHSQDDAVDQVEVEEHIDCYPHLEAQDGAFGDLRIVGGGTAFFERCEMDSILFFTPETQGYLNLTGCLVQGGFRAEGGWFGPILLELDFAHSTILGDLWSETADACLAGYVKSNIIMGEIDIAVGDALVFQSNDVLGDIDVPGATFIDNISEDPLFCDAESGNYTLQDCSPCVGTAHDGGDIGAFGVGCECIVAVEGLSWGRIKSLYR